MFHPRGGYRAETLIKYDVHPATSIVLPTACIKQIDSADAMQEPLNIPRSGRYQRELVPCVMLLPNVKMFRQKLIVMHIL